MKGSFTSSVASKASAIDLVEEEEEQKFEE
jgi:hypothetical protein